jgi:hypothetical protein
MSEQKRASKVNAGDARGRGPAVVEEVRTPVIRASFAFFLSLARALGGERSLSIDLF